MGKMVALLLLIMILGSTAYVVYTGILLPLLQPFLKNKP